MVGKKLLTDGVSPSYFLEGMLWNVPNAHFGTSYVSTVVETLNWVKNADATKLACANDLHWLIRDGTSVCWPSKDFDVYLKAVTKYWNDW